MATVPSVTPRPLTALPPGYMASDYVKGDQYARPALAAALKANDAAVSRLHELHRDMREGYAKIEKAFQTPDKTRTPEGQYIAVHKHAETWRNAIADRSDIVSKNGRMALDAIDADIARTLDIGATTYAPEIRERLSKMSPSERMATARRAIEANDKDVVGALLNGPAFLSGFSDADRNTLRQSYSTKYAAELVERRKAIELALHVNFEAFNGVILGLGSLFPKARVAEITSSMTEAQSALDDILR